MSDAQEMAVRAVVLSQELGRRRRELEALQKKGVADPQRELIIKNLEKILDEH
jgi:hypothetical protein